MSLRLKKILAVLFTLLGITLIMFSPFIGKILGTVVLIVLIIYIFKNIKRKEGK